METIECVDFVNNKAKKDSDFIINMLNVKVQQLIDMHQHTV
jgi:hypothetical protein